MADGYLHVCTGGSQENPETIMLNDTPFWVTSNLKGALTQLRQAIDVVVLWIDAIAINQSDIPERNQQVSSMCDIYSRAERTVICLDPTGNQAIEKFYELIPVIITTARYLDYFLSDLMLACLADAVSKIACYKYWHRVWVIQEVMYSRHLVIVHGNCTTEYTDFVRVWDLMIKLVEEDSSLTGSDRPRWLSRVATPLDTAGPKVLPSPGAALRGEFIRLDEWAHFVQLKLSTDPRDYVFGYHGCFSPEVRRRINVDYSASADEVWTAITQLVIFEHGLDILVRSAARDLLPTGSAMPSWVPCLRPRAISRTDQFRIPLYMGLAPSKRYKAAGDTVGIKFNEDVIEQRSGKLVLRVTGVIIGTVKALADPDNHFTLNVEDGLRGMPARLLEEFPELVKQSYVSDYFHKSWEDLIDLDADPQDFGDAFGLQMDLSEWRIDDALAGGRLSPPEDATKENTAFLNYHFKRNMFSYCVAWKPERFGTSYGLGPDTVSPGDLVCVLFGCTVPVILRRVGDSGHHILVGDAFIPGCMSGEAVQEGTEERIVEFLIE